MAPKMGLFYRNSPKHPLLSIFRLINSHALIFQSILHHWIKKTFWLPIPPKKIEFCFHQKFQYGYFGTICLDELRTFFDFKNSSDLALMNFCNQKKFSAHRRNSFRYPYWYFWWKQISIFFWGREGGGQKVNLFFISWCEIAWKNIHDNKFVEKCLIGVVLDFLLQKSLNLGALLTLELFFSCTIEYVSWKNRASYDKN